MEGDVGGRLEVPVIPVLNFYPVASSGVIANQEFGADRKQMRVLPDLHVIPRNVCVSLRKLEIRGESARFFVQLNYVAARIVNGDVPGSRGIVSLVVEIEVWEASIHRRRKAVFEKLPSARLRTALVLDGGRTPGVEQGA